MAPTLDGYRRGTAPASAPHPVIALTALVTRAADRWFELQITQFPDLVVQASSLGEAPQAVREAAARSTGRPPEEFDVHVQW
ncbi:hypothetical protein ACFRJ9_06860 [Paenarthrobacter sp. NPDC056912]|uniref:hypothetical protein n=1 Tax=Paenarthrobacter sp. NPDC056912 TaxID=3345965 RepID=UPI00366C9E61